MPKLKPCPVEGCKRKWMTVHGLGNHLFKEHHKSELVKVIQKLLGL